MTATMTDDRTDRHAPKKSDDQHALWHSKVQGWKSELKLAQAKAAKGSAELDQTFARAADELRHRATRLELKIEQMKSGLDHDVSRLTDEVEHGWQELREDFRKKANELLSR